jgi:shikimate dehydrogenase
MPVLDITGKTELWAIIGDPVAPLRSPALFNQAFADQGRDAVFVALEVGAGDLTAAWQGLSRIGNLQGVVVTMPHKEAILPLLDGLGPTARLTGTVNTVRRRPQGGWEGEMFDGEGFRDGVERAGHDWRGKRVLQVGCGAAGRAIALALARAGVAHLGLCDVSGERAAALAARLEGVAAPLDRPQVKGFDIVVNATPLGLRAGDPLPFDPGALAPGQVVADVIPNPEMTPLLQAAQARGCAIVTGRSMHEGQARLASAWLGL